MARRKKRDFWDDVEDDVTLQEESDMPGILPEIRVNIQNMKMKDSGSHGACR